MAGLRDTCSSIRWVAACGIAFASCTAPPPTSAPSKATLAPATGRTHVVDTAALDVAQLPPATVRPWPALAPAQLGSSGEAIAPRPFLRTYSADDGLPVDAFWSGTVDRDGLLWFGSNGGGLVRFDGRRFTTFGLEHGLSDNVVLSLCAARNGELWIGTSMGGLCRYDGRAFRTYGMEDGLPNKGIHSLLEDPRGVIWIGTRGKGLSRWDGKAFRTFTEADGYPAEHVFDMDIDAQGLLWLGTEKGLMRYDGIRFTTYGKEAGTAFNGARMLCFTTNGDLWLGAWDGRVVRARMPQNTTDAPVFEEVIDLGDGARRLNRIRTEPGRRPVVRHRRRGPIQPDEVLGETIPGVKYVHIGDVGRTDNLVEICRDADTLVIEATYIEEDAEMAKAFGHLTAVQAARLAVAANVKSLLLTHLSRRYAERQVREEARAIFPATEVARDLDHFQISREGAVRLDGSERPQGEDEYRGRGDG